MINGLLINELKKAPSKLILNGYPRNLNQVKQVEEFCPLNLVVALKLDKKILMDRLSKQLVHPASGRAYNLNFNPPKVEGKDDITGEPLFPRLDDQMEIARRRIEIYDKTETKVVDYYRSGNSNLRIEIFLKRFTKVMLSFSKIITCQKKDEKILEKII
ncbi:hypothetical protein WR25_02861 isoform D [Diploscapter pachys]|nr:hypothetical protein WR25_02861 isoform D [Diploscapter pachys]